MYYVRRDLELGLARLISQFHENNIDNKNSFQPAWFPVNTGAQGVRLYKYALLFSSCYAFSYDITEAEWEG